MVALLKLGVIYKALEVYESFAVHQFWSQAMFETLGRPHKPGCAITAKAIVEHDRVLTGDIRG